MGEKILIVDDDTGIVTMMGMRLRSAGYEILTATDGLSAIAQVHRELPDLVLLDVNLPKGDGLSVLQNLRDSEKTDQIPVIMLTGFANEETIRKARDFKASYCLSKPYDPDDLVELIQKVLVTQEENPPVEVDVERWRKTGQY